MSAHPLLPAEVQAEYRRLRYWEGITLAEIVAERATASSAASGHCWAGALTYSELWQRARRLAGYLVDAGMQPGEFLIRCNRTPGKAWCFPLPLRSPGSR